MNNKFFYSPSSDGGSNSTLGVGGFEVWFITGSQDLYGEETLKQVAEHSKTIAKALNDATQIPVHVVFKPTVKSPEEIYNICVAANTDKNVIGVITWMHT